MDIAATITLAPGFTLRDSLLMNLGAPNMAAFNALPESIRNAALEGLVNQQIVPLGYDPLGIDAGSGINARLVQGSYTAVFDYGWTEFQIGPVTQALTVTSHGVAPYNAVEMVADPAGVVARMPHNCRAVRGGASVVNRAGFMAHAASPPWRGPPAQRAGDLRLP